MWALLTKSIDVLEGHDETKLRVVKSIFVLWLWSRANNLYRPASLLLPLVRSQKSGGSCRSSLLIGVGLLLSPLCTQCATATKVRIMAPRSACQHNVPSFAWLQTSANMAGFCKPIGFACNNHSLLSTIYPEYSWMVHFIAIICCLSNIWERRAVKPSYLLEHACQAKPLSCLRIDWKMCRGSCPCLPCPTERCALLTTFNSILVECNCRDKVSNPLIVYLVLICPKHSKTTHKQFECQANDMTREHFGIQLMKQGRLHQSSQTWSTNWHASKDQPTQLQLIYFSSYTSELA